MNLHIEKYHHTGSGFNPFFIRDNWQVAQLNYMPELGFENIERLEMHAETDEVFILTKGTAVLIAGIEINGEFQFELMNMELGLTCNVPVHTWHSIAMSTDAALVIVEKSNTHLVDVAYRALSNAEKENLDKAIQTSLLV